MILTGQIVFIIKDTNEMTNYSKLIHDKQEKNDKLLATILPELLVLRVQSGEKKITFAVKSAFQQLFSLIF